MAEKPLPGRWYGGCTSVASEVIRNMNVSRACLLSSFFALFVATPAFGADPVSVPEGEATLSVVGAQFGDKVEGGKPVGDGKGGALVTYFVEVKNPGAEAAVTLVWSHDGKETARQSLDVGRSPKWRTWGMATVRGAKTIEVRVLSPSGQELRKDVLDRG